jgi:hypothetical protein
LSLFSVHEQGFIQGGFLIESWMHVETRDLPFIINPKAVMKKQWADGPLPLIETPWHKLASPEPFPTLTSKSQMKIHTN